MYNILQPFTTTKNYIHINTNYLLATRTPKMVHMFTFLLFVTIISNMKHKSKEVYKINQKSIKNIK